MSGRLVGLVRDHGPEDHNAWAVLTVIAEDLHGPLRTATLDNVELGRSARLGRTSVKTALAYLVADGWLARTPGRHTGIASTYQLRLDRFPAEAVEKVLDRGRHTTPVEVSEISTGVATRPQSGKEGSPHGKEGSPHDPPSVSVTTPSLPDVALPLLVGLASATRTEGQLEHETEPCWDVVLADVPAGARPRAGLRQVWADASASGWTPEALRAELAAARHNYAAIGGGAVLLWLRTTAQRPAPAAAKPEPTGPLCRICSRHEDDCRRYAQATNDDHDYSPPTDDDVPRQERLAYIGSFAPFEVGAGWG